MQTPNPHFVLKARVSYTPLYVLWVSRFEPLPRCRYQRTRILKQHHSSTCNYASGVITIPQKVICLDRADIYTSSTLGSRSRSCLRVATYITRPEQRYCLHILRLPPQKSYEVRTRWPLTYTQWTGHLLRTTRSFSLMIFTHILQIFIPQIPGHCIARLSLPGELVFDPFGGSGTTALEAVRLGRRALSIDANPVGTLIGRVKACNLNKPTASDIRSIRSSLVSRIEDLPSASLSMRGILEMDSINTKYR